MAEGDLKWRYDFGTLQYSGIITGSDGVIYFGTGNAAGNNYIYAINPGGTLKWRYLVGDRIWSGLALSNDESVVYSGCDNNFLYGIYTTTGLSKFNYDSGFSIRSGIAVDTSDKIYFGNANEIESLNYDGTSNWQQVVYGDLHSQITISGTKLYAAFETGNLHELKLSDGTENWNYPGATGWSYGTGVTVATDGTIYFGNEDNHAYAINPDGSQKWNYDAAGNVETANAIGSNGNIWFGTNFENHKVFVLKASDGSLVWDYNLPANIGSTYDTTGLALDSNDIAYAGCWDNKMYALNSNGTFRWDYTTGGNIESGVAFSHSAEDTVYFASHDGFLYALEKRPAPAGGGSSLPLLSKLLL